MDRSDSGGSLGSSRSEGSELLVLQQGWLVLLALETPDAQQLLQQQPLQLPCRVYATLTDLHVLLARSDDAALEPFFVVPLAGGRRSVVSVSRPQAPGTTVVVAHAEAGTATLQAPGVAAAKRWARAVDLAISALATEQLERGLEATGCRIYPDQLRLAGPDTAGAFAGGGGMGVVVRGLLLGRIPVAVKELRFSEEFSTQRDKESFFREMAMLSAVDHPSIVRFFGFCRSPQGRVRMVTEFVPGGDLSGYLFDEAHYPIDERRAARLALAISEGVEFLHSKGVVHRDLKPENVLVADWASCQVRICDFGLCRSAEQRASWTMNMGTPIYAAPEFDASGSAFPLDAYSFGVILWEIAARKEPFKDCKWVSDIRSRIERGEHPPVPEGAPGWLRTLADRCRSVDPKERPSFADISGVLRGALQDITIRTGSEVWAPSPSLTPRESSKHKHRHRHQKSQSGTGSEDQQQPQHQQQHQQKLSSSSDQSDLTLSEYGPPLSRQESESSFALSTEATPTATAQLLPQTSPLVTSPQLETSTAPGLSPRQERADSVGEPAYAYTTTTTTTRGRFVSSADLSPLVPRGAAAGFRESASRFRRGTLDAPGSGTESVRAARSSSLSKPRGSAKISPVQTMGSSAATEAPGTTAPTAPVPQVHLHQLAQSPRQQPRQQQPQSPATANGGDLTNWGFFGFNGAVVALRIMVPAFEEVWLTELPNCKDGVVTVLVDPRTATVYAACNGRVTAMSSFLGLIKWQAAIPSLDGARLSMQFLEEANSIVLGGAGHLVCISRDRGTTLWDTALPGRSTFGTLVHILQYPGNAQRLLAGSNGHLIFVDTASGTIENIVPMNSHISFGVTLTAFSTAAIDTNPLIVNAATNSLLCTVTAAGFLTRTNAFKTPFAITQLVVRETLVLAYYHKGVKVRAFHPATLRQRWRTSLLGRAFGSVTTVASLAQSDREPSFVYVGCSGWIFALDVVSGKEKAKVSLPGSHSGPTLVHAFPMGVFGGLLFASCHGSLFLLDPSTLALVHKATPQLQHAGPGGSNVITAASAGFSIDEHSSGFLLAGISKQPQP